MPVWSLKRRIVLINVAVVSLAVLLMALFFYRGQQVLLERSLVERGSAAAQQLAYLSGTILQQKLTADARQASLQTLSSLALEDRTVRSVSIKLPSLSSVAAAGPAMLPSLDKRASPTGSKVSIFDTESSLRFQHPVILVFSDSAQNGNKDSASNLGQVEIEYANHPAIIHMFEVLIVSGAIALGAIIGLISLALFSTRSYSEKFNRILAAAELSGDQKNQQKIAIEFDGGRDELDMLAGKLNRMWERQRIHKRKTQRSESQATQDLRETLEALEVQNIELDLARKEAIEASVMKSDFLASTSHEIRTPLNGIVGFSNLLLQTPLDGKQQDFAKTILQSANSLIRIINDILDFSKIEAGKLALDDADVNLQELLEQTLELLVPMTLDKNIELNSYVHHAVPDFVRADGLRLQQVLTNLVHNAIKFTDAGEVSVALDLNAEKELEITVSDTGIGLTEQQQTTVFKAFSQANQSVSRTYGGTGLGLMIAKRLVQLMGGELALRSVVGEGAVFHFNMPFRASTRKEQSVAVDNLTVCYFEANATGTLSNLLQRWKIETLKASSIIDLYGMSQPSSNDEKRILLANLVTHNFAQAENLDLLQQLAAEHHCIFVCADNVLEQATQNLKGEHCRIISKPLRNHELREALIFETDSAAENSVNPATKMDSPRVLLVDDYAPNLKLLTIMLQQRGINVLPVSNGAEAISCCNHEQFALIFMDIRMPEISGIEATQIIRTESRLNKTTPIVAVTAHADPEERREMLSSGFTDHMGKPIMEDELTTMLNKWCQQQELQPRQTTSLPAPTPRKPATQPVDLKACLEVSGHRANIAHDMLSKLLEQLPNDREAISASRVADDLDSYRELVHRLHGHACYTGVPHLRQLCHAIEDSITSEKYDQARQLGVALETEIDRLLAWQSEHDLSALFSD